VAEEGTPGGVRREMARKTMRAMRGDLYEEADLIGSAMSGSPCVRRQHPRVLKPISFVVPFTATCM
jgi:hypothetical protein